MDGLSHVTTPEPRKVQLGEHALRLRALTLRDYGAIETRILASLPDPLELAAKSAAILPVEHARIVLERAWNEAIRRRGVTQEQAIAFLWSTEGLAFALWLAGGKDAGLSEEQVTEAVMNLDKQALLKLKREIDEAAGLKQGN